MRPDSSASISTFFRHAGNGKLYWIGNIMDDPSLIDGNDPRWPLVICEVNERWGCLKKARSPSSIPSGRTKSIPNSPTPVCLSIARREIWKSVSYYSQSKRQKLIHSLQVMLETIPFVRAVTISHNRSTTSARERKISFRNPTERRTFQICSMGFISGV